MGETVFTKVDYTLGGLVGAIELGTIGLPDIQRPFVWKNALVRNLFDSMYRGFPIGYLLFWKNGAAQGARGIGVDQKQKIPELLIVDGQQRLTSLYAVIKGIAVVRENYEQENIEIAFNPLLEKFEVTDAAIRKDKSFIPNISVVWSANTDLFELVESYLTSLSEVREVSVDEKKFIRKTFTRLQNLLSFPFTVLELSADIDEEQVSEVFVRINSEGKKLNQADFILTLMSVFWDAGRTELENFSQSSRKPTKEASPFNYFIEPSPDQLLRVCVGLGFRRARLQYVYSILRGKDLDTGIFSGERRDSQFQVLKKAQERVLDLTYWHDFFKSIMLAGFRSGQIISSKNNLLFAYILYLLGRTEYRVDEYELRRLIARWFFMSALTGRYSSSPELKMEFDLARLRGVTDANSFMNILREICDATLTNDYWKITLPGDLATAAANSPSMFAYFAALTLHDANVLFSKQKVGDLLNPATKSKRAALERHHLFPKKYLNKLGISDLRQTNQIANFTLIEWGDNAEILDSPPEQYVPLLSKRFSPEDISKMYHWHALPDHWEKMDYSGFLKRRRELMANVIREAYESLVEDKQNVGTAAALSVTELINVGEGSSIEFKSTLRTNLHTGLHDAKVEMAALKTIAGFLNMKGGALVIGISDNGEPVGIDADHFQNEDKMNLHLVNLINSRIGPTSMMYIHSRFEDHDGTRVMVVDCTPSKVPIFVKDGPTERFLIRTGAATSDLTHSQTQDYIKQRFVA